MWEEWRRGKGIQPFSILFCYKTRIDLISMGFCSIIFTYRGHRGFPPWLCLHTSRNTSSPLAQFPASRSKRQTTDDSPYHASYVLDSTLQSFLVIKVPARTSKQKTWKKTSCTERFKVRAVRSKLNSLVASPSSFHLFSHQLSFPPFSFPPFWPLRAAIWIQVVASIAAPRFQKRKPAHTHTQKMRYAIMSDIQFLHSSFF